MSEYKTVSWLLGLSVPLLLSATRCWGGDAPEKATRSLNVAVTVGALRITNNSVELRCEISNKTGQDIWVYDEGPHEHDRNGVRGTNAEVYLDREGQTLLILRGINLPLHGITSAPRLGTYARLRAGESRPYVFLVVLPIRVEYHDLQGFSEAIRKGTEYLTRLAFQIGYYIREDLERYPASIGPSKHIESQDRVQIHAYQVSPIVCSERAATVKMEGVCIPYKRWIIRVEEDPEKRAQQLSEKPAPLTLLETLRDLFYSFSLDLEQYRYARQLLTIDRDLLGDRAMRLVDVYVRAAQGKLNPTELARHLDEVMGRSDREKLLQGDFEGQPLN